MNNEIEIDSFIQREASFIVQLKHSEKIFSAESGNKLSPVLAACCQSINDIRILHATIYNLLVNLRCSKATHFVSLLSSVLPLFNLYTPYCETCVEAQSCAKDQNLRAALLAPLMHLISYDAAVRGVEFRVDSGHGDDDKQNNACSPITNPAIAALSDRFHDITTSYISKIRQQEQSEAKARLSRLIPPDLQLSFKSKFILEGEL